jgi:hypothetical protein
MFPTGPVAPVFPTDPVGPVFPKIPVSPSKFTFHIFEVISPSINVIYTITLPVIELYESTFPSK